MFSKLEDFELFKRDVASILSDTFVQKPDKDEFEKITIFFNVVCG